MTLVPANEKTVSHAAKALRAGSVVAFPTETVYGLGADATNAQSVARVFEIKGRPRFNPLIVHVANVEEAHQLVSFNAMANTLAEAFWPGPLSLVLNKKAGIAICDLVSAGLDTLAVRVPQHRVAQNLLREAGCPVAAPSANKAGHVSPTTAQHVLSDLGDDPDFILDGGPVSVGLESTVVGFNDERPIILRPGGIERSEIEHVLGRSMETGGDAKAPSSPGQLASHYAPSAEIRLNAHTVEAHEALLGFGPETPDTSGPKINLSPEGDLRAAAIHFFSALRELDASGAGTIAVSPIPDEGLGEAINDRLKRAAAPRTPV